MNQSIRKSATLAALQGAIADARLNVRAYRAPYPLHSGGAHISTGLDAYIAHNAGKAARAARMRAAGKLAANAGYDPRDNAHHFKCAAALLTAVQP